MSIGLHWGTVLTNGKLVTGPAVSAVARIAEVAGSSQVLLSQHALHRIPRVTQAQCTPVAASIGDELELYSLPWDDERGLARQVRIEESGKEHALPSQDIIAFGRLDALADGTRANDIVLTHPDREAQLAISRWHFELRRTRRGHMLRTVSNRRTEVDGRTIEAGEEAQVRPGTTVRLAQVMTLRFLGSEQSDPNLYTVTSPPNGVTLKRGMDVRVRKVATDDPDKISTAPDEISTAPPPPLRG